MKEKGVKNNKKRGKNREVVRKRYKQRKKIDKGEKNEIKGKKRKEERL